MAAQPIDPAVPAEPVPSYAFDDLRDHLAEALAAARYGGQPVLITDQDEPLAAIVSIEELDRLYDERETAEVIAIVREIETQEARGEAVWYSMDDIRELQRDIEREAELEVERRRKGTAGTDVACRDASDDTSEQSGAQGRHTHRPLLAHGASRSSCDGVPDS